MYFNEQRIVTDSSKTVKRQLAELLVKSLQDDDVKRALVEIVRELCKDPEVVEAATEMVLGVIAQERVLQVKESSFRRSPFELFTA